MRWILLILGVFGLCGGVAIAYWRQTNVDVSPASMLVVLVLLPSVVVGTIYGIYRLNKWLKERREAEQEKPQDAAGEMTLAEGPAAPWLHVYATAVQTQLGDHADKIILGLQQFSAAECDAELFNTNGSRLLSRRIDLTINNEIDDAKNLSVRAQRIEALTQNLYEQLDQTFAAIFEGMTETHLWQLPTESRQAILHPAWQGKSVEAPLQPEKIEQKSVWPKLFKVLYFLPDHLDQEEQQYLQRVAYAQMLRYGFQAEQIKWTNHITHEPDETLQQIGNALVDQSQSNGSSMQLIMGADSHLDQDLVDELLQENAKLIPAEGSFSFLITNDATDIPLPVLARLTAPMLIKRQKPISVGGQLGADALTTGLDELRRIYKLQEADFVPDTGVLISDIHPAQNANLRELSLVLRSFDLPAEDLMYAGSLLENTDVMTSGVALALALQQAESSKLHVPIMCSAGDALRGLWLAAPYSQTPVSIESPAESEPVNRVSENA